MQLVYSFYIKHNEDIDKLCKVSTNLYNQALYIVRTTLDKEGKWLFYSDLNKIMPQTLNLDGECNYRLLKAQVAQQTLRSLEKNVKSYVKSIKDWKKAKEKYKAMPQFPHYKKRGSMSNLCYTNQSCSVRKGFINLSKDLRIAIPQWEKYKDNFRRLNQVRIKPSPSCVKVEIVYTKDVVAKELDGSKFASIDLGIDNLATLVTPDSSVLYSGKFLKSYNRQFNKKLHKLQSIKDKQGIKRSTKRIQRMYYKRDMYLQDVFHKYSRCIVEYLIENKIGNLVVGYNMGWKQSVNIGKKNNQKFVQIPYARLISYLEYKCNMNGIKFQSHEESYTSKCDALALEPIGKHEEYLGRRVKRGLFRSSTGKVINADQNGALNILRKVVGDSEFTRIVDSGHSLCPVRHRTPFFRGAGSM